MRSIALAAIALTLFSSAASASETATETRPGAEATEAPKVETEMTADNEDSETVAPENEMADFCFLAGTPPDGQKYTVIKKLKVVKGTYGRVKDVLPRLAYDARKAGADAVINYVGTQRHGLVPWGYVRPVARGEAIKWADPQNQNCTSIGGSTLKELLAADEPPSH